MAYALTGKRDCLILSIEKYHNARSRTNAQEDALRPDSYLKKFLAAICKT